MRWLRADPLGKCEMDPVMSGCSEGWGVGMAIGVIGPGAPQRGGRRVPPPEGEGGWAVWPGCDVAGGLRG